MNGVCREPMMSRYSSFSMTMTAMWAGGPPRNTVTGDAVVWTVPWRAALVPQPHNPRTIASANAHMSTGARRPVTGVGGPVTTRSGSAIAEPLATAMARPSASATSARATAVRRPACTNVAWAVASRPSLASGRR